MGQYGPADIVLRAGLPYSRGLTYVRDAVPQSWVGRTNRLQVRHAWRDDLLIELTAFLEFDPATPTRLELNLPASFTATLREEGRWDLVSVSNTNPDDIWRTPQTPGRVLVLQGVTRA